MWTFAPPGSAPESWLLVSEETGQGGLSEGVRVTQFRVVGRTPPLLSVSLTARARGAGWGLGPGDPCPTISLTEASPVFCRISEALLSSVWEQLISSSTLSARWSRWPAGTRVGTWQHS